MAFAYNEAYKTGKYDPANSTGHVTKKMTLIISTFRGYLLYPPQRS